MATMKDVAREAGVSTATISRYLHDSPNILPQTRELIEAAIEKLDYHPNHLARQFRTQRTGIILVLLPEIENSFFHKIIAGIESVVEKAGYRVMISEIHNKPENERYFFECLIQKQVDGIITFSARLEQEEVERLASSHPLVVACRKYKGSQIPNVTIDNEKASKDITNYILNLGHKKICYLAGDTKILLYQDRLKGFLDALRERKIEHSPSLLCTGLTTMQDGYDATLRLINSGESFTAVVASGDSSALTTIMAPVFSSPSSFWANFTSSFVAWT
ncbi:MAG: LacI family DNA-binding transcriptional regulator [Blautia sp.]|nr:LacI family DNA-binding transcriptional regulator [Blautia sp.]